ncbi:MAG: DUF4783 domain-containing protein [Cyclobacteriaceae bacterium]
MRKIITLILGLYIISPVMGQDEVLSDVETALSAGSAKELVKYCLSSVRLQINGDNKVYSKPQAEAVLRDFFQKNAAQEFQYTHRGSSPGGLVYCIGQYKISGASFRVYMLLKESNDQFLIDTISFNKE